MPNQYLRIRIGYNGFRLLRLRNLSTCIGMGTRTPHYGLKRLRKILGREMTQEKFAARIGVSYPYLLSIETGQREMTMAVAKRITMAFGVDPRSMIAPNGIPMRLADKEVGLVPFAAEPAAAFRAGPMDIEEEFARTRPDRTNYPMGLTLWRLLYASGTRRVLPVVSGEFFEWVSSMLLAFPEIGSEFFRVSSDLEFDALVGDVQAWNGTYHVACHVINEVQAKMDAAKAKKNKRKKGDSVDAASRMLVQFRQLAQSAAAFLGELAKYLEQSDMTEAGRTTHVVIQKLRGKWGLAPSLPVSARAPAAIASPDSATEQPAPRSPSRRRRQAVAH